MLQRRLEQLPDPYAPAHGKAGHALLLARTDGPEEALVYLEEDPSSLQSPASAPALGVWVGLRQGVGAPRMRKLASRLKPALEGAPNSFEIKTVLARFYSPVIPSSVEQAALLLEEAIARGPRLYAESVESNRVIGPK